MKIYAACLASYNNGVLHGRWIDASSDVDAMHAEISAMLRESRFPNVMRCDYESEGGETVTVTNSFGEAFAPSIERDGETYQANGAPYRSAEEWAIHDYDGHWPNFGEYPGLDKIAAYMELVEFAEDECGMSAELVDGVVDHFGSDYLDAAKDAIEGYQGHHANLGDYAESFLEDCGTLQSIPEQFRNYIDFDAYGRDMELNGDIFTVNLDGGIHVFWNH